jgi:hypothetical protein
VVAAQAERPKRRRKIIPVKPTREDAAARAARKAAKDAEREQKERERRERVEEKLRQREEVLRARAEAKAKREEEAAARAAAKEAARIAREEARIAKAAAAAAGAAEAAAAPVQLGPDGLPLPKQKKPKKSHTGFEARQPGLVKPSKSRLKLAEVKPDGTIALPANRVVSAPNVLLCAFCLIGGDLAQCTGPCQRAFHYTCIGMDGAAAVAQKAHMEDWECPDCMSGVQRCFRCNVAGRVGDPSTGRAYSLKPSTGKKAMAAAAAAQAIAEASGAGAGGYSASKFPVTGFGVMVPFSEVAAASAAGGGGAAAGDGDTHMAEAAVAAAPAVGHGGGGVWEDPAAAAAAAAVTAAAAAAATAAAAAAVPVHVSSPAVAAPAVVHLVVAEPAAVMAGSLGSIVGGGGGAEFGAPAAMVAPPTIFGGAPFGDGAAAAAAAVVAAGGVGDGGDAAACGGGVGDMGYPMSVSMQQQMVMSGQLAPGAVDFHRIARLTSADFARLSAEEDQKRTEELLALGHTGEGVMGMDLVFKCTMGRCGKFFHLPCVRTLPLTNYGTWKTETYVCRATTRRAHTRTRARTHTHATHGLMHIHTDARARVCVS